MDTPNERVAMAINSGLLFDKISSGTPYVKNDLRRLPISSVAPPKVLPPNQSVYPTRNILQGVSISYKN